MMGLGGRSHVDSAGTGDWHVGGPIDKRAGRTLAEVGYDPSRHRARQFRRGWYADYDLVLALDASNFADLSELAAHDDDRAKLQMFRSFDPQVAPGDDEVPDPWYGGEEGFVDVLATIERTADALVDRLPELIEQR